MKFFVCILSIYILVLTAIPCIDEPEVHCFAQTEKTSDSGSSHQHDGDQCSPFCTCNCCATPVIQKDFTISFNGFTIVRKSHFSHYTSNFFSSYRGSIWQPPQIA